MKTKKFSAKLLLNKKTIANLINAEMSNLKGGEKTRITCGSCWYTMTCNPCPCITEPDCTWEPCTVL